MIDMSRFVLLNSKKYIKQNKEALTQQPRNAEKANTLNLKLEKLDLADAWTIMYEGKSIRPLGAIFPLVHIVTLLISSVMCFQCSLFQILLSNKNANNQSNVVIHSGNSEHFMFLIYEVSLLTNSLIIALNYISPV